MTDEMRTTWLEEDKRLVHDVSITGIHGPHARSIETDCGVPVWVVKVEGDGRRTCLACELIQYGNFVWRRSLVEA